MNDDSLPITWTGMQILFLNQSALKDLRVFLKVTSEVISDMRAPQAKRKFNPKENNPIYIIEKTQTNRDRKIFILKTIGDL
jgi:hypothetical protein